MQRTNYILTITGSDGSGASGVQADIGVMTALGSRALTAITSLTLQNSLGIQQFYDVPAQIVAGEIAAVEDDYSPRVVKVGMIRRVETLAAVVAALRKYAPRYVIYDPIVSSSFGTRLMSDELIAVTRTQLLPLCSLVIIKRDDMRHFLLSDGDDGVVVLGDDCTRHGMAGSLSAAIAAYLNQGLGTAEAIAAARSYVRLHLPENHVYEGRPQEMYKQFEHDVALHHRTRGDVAFYADCQNVSSRYLAQVTKKLTGKSPKAIIDEYILEHVSAALLTSGQNIQEIAFYFGFSSQAHFTKFFRKMTGMTPTEYRKKNK